MIYDRRAAVKRLIEKIKNEKGAAMVEFAIVLPLLLMLVFGMIEFSIMFYDKAVITNASREGARAGIVYDFPDRISTGDIETTVGNYCGDRLITFGSTNQVNTSVIGPCINAGDTITVTVTYPYDFLVLPNFVTTLTGPMDLSAVTIMRCE
jgi:Flp pilus assembly protein TadG